MWATVAETKAAITVPGGGRSPKDLLPRAAGGWSQRPVRSADGETARAGEQTGEVPAAGGVARVPGRMQLGSLRQEQMARERGRAPDPDTDKPPEGPVRTHVHTVEQHVHKHHCTLECAGTRHSLPS